MNRAVLKIGAELEGLGGMPGSSAVDRRIQISNQNKTLLVKLAINTAWA
ncbi:MAG: hypothetical protein R3289_02550 [Photobacterium sp.]|nr:hypothetical protein [Photobacterium sp.]